MPAESVRADPARSDASRERPYLRAVIVTLLIFSPLAFGSVEPWAVAVLECGIFLTAAVFFLGALSAGKTAAVSLPRIPLAAGGVFLAYSAVLAASGGSVSPGDTREAVVLGAAYVVFFALTVAVLKSENQADLLCQILIFLGFGVALLSILQFYGWNGKIYWIRETSRAMAYGPFINRNHLAGYLGMLIPLGAGFLAGRLMMMKSRGDSLWRRLIRAITRPESTQIVLIFFALLVMGVALLLTLSRGGIASFLSAMAIMGGFLFARRGGRRLAVLPVVLVVAVAVGLSWFGVGPLIDRLMSLRDADRDPSVALRTAVWIDTARMAADHSWTGTGAGTFAIAFPRYKTLPDQFLFDHAHNDYLQWLAENGAIGSLIGAAALAGIMMVGVRGLVRRRHPAVWGMLLGAFAGASALLLHGLTDFNLHIPGNAMLFTALLALIWSLSKSGSGERPPASGGPVGRAAAVGGAILFLSLFFMGLSSGMADHHHRAGLRHEAAGEDARAAESFRRAAAWNGSKSEYRYRVARLHEAEWLKTRAPGSLDSAESELREAAALSPTVAEYHLHLGWVHAMRGRRDEATEEFRKVLELDPSRADWRHYVGLWYAAIGDKSRAEEQVQALRNLKSEAKAKEVEARL